MPVEPSASLLLALHYQNENCHPDGKIKIGIADGSDLREERLGNAERLLEGARLTGIPIVHVRFAMRPDLANVIANTPMFRQILDLNAWLDGSWGAEFLAGLGPVGDEIVVSHARNNAFYGSPLEEIVFGYRPRRLYCAGVSTAYAVDSAVRHATDMGYPVTVVADACCTGQAAQHDNAVASMALLAEIRTVDDVLLEFGGK